MQHKLNSANVALVFFFTRPMKTVNKKVVSNARMRVAPIAETSHWVICLYRIS